LPRRRSSATLKSDADSGVTNEGENTDMAEENGDLFETLDADQWREQGGVGNTERGLYGRVLEAFVRSGSRYAVISMNKGRFAGKKASSVSTALKTTLNGKNAPEGSDQVKVSSRAGKEDGSVEGAVFLENHGVEA
jgi:hypothetical protein